MLQIASIVVESAVFVPAAKQQCTLYHFVIQMIKRTMLKDILHDHWAVLVDMPDS